MKQVILGAALCGAALAMAGAAHADGGNEFLSGSTNALILGPTGVPTPDPGYISAAESLYLDPNGYAGTATSTLALTTPETYEFGQSVAQGENDLVNAVVADYAAGDMGCATSGVCSDPLTIFTYSQSSLIASLAEQELADDKIPSDAIRFVMLGADRAAVPDSLYPTEVYNIDGDVWANPSSVGSTLPELELGLLLHDAYLGLTPAEIDAATPVADGLTTYFDIPALTDIELWGALFRAWLAG